ncbi:MAG: hypothetical protein E6R04_08215 [Spirochaetes bacterium]|nr:MAG: hypothetical protein E6R04_08215 [Spirochaetota bacterium]
MKKSDLEYLLSPEYANGFYDDQGNRVFGSEVIRLALDGWKMRYEPISEKGINQAFEQLDKLIGQWPKSE